LIDQTAKKSKKYGRNHESLQNLASLDKP
jgi:hypothetical protein